jgi:hypothetical protein
MPADRSLTSPSKGNTPLHALVTKQAALENICFCLQFGADANYTNKVRTPRAHRTRTTAHKASQREGTKLAWPIWPSCAQAGKSPFDLAPNGDIHLVLMSFAEDRSTQGVVRERTASVSLSSPNLPSPRYTHTPHHTHRNTHTRARAHTHRTHANEEVVHVCRGAAGSEGSPLSPEVVPRARAMSLGGSFERPENWEADESVSACRACNASFILWRRRHHCRSTCASLTHDTHRTHRTRSTAHTNLCVDQAVG